MFRAAFALIVLGCTAVVYGQVAGGAGNMLVGRSFLYAGESHNRRIVIVRDGKVAWTYDDPVGKGEISDAVMLSNGNILFTHQFGVTEINPDKQVVWNYDAPAGHEVHTAVPIGKDHVLFLQNGDPALLRVVNTVTGATEKEFNLPVKRPVSVHGQFRHARLTANGTLLVAHMDLNKVVEYDANGAELWSFPAATPWGVNPLANGNVLITDSVGVREVTRRGDSVWSFTAADAPGFVFSQIQLAWRLPNGNTVVNNWVNEWSRSADSIVGTLQALEVTPDKKAVAVLNSWVAPVNLGPATTIQFLNAAGLPEIAPEDMHFGDIH